MSSRLAATLLAIVLAGSLALKLRHLDHPDIKPLDEVFHAIVARNFLKHPLTPTLVDQPYLAYDRDDWLANHIWLHKPPMAMWQIAVSYSLVGVGALGLRLPSAILSTLAAWLTYLIGARLLDRRAGLIAAALQAFNPVILMLVHGYVFSDHVDISLLFWTELSIYFLVRGTQEKGKANLILCGVAQGLGFLSKTYPALIVTLLSLAATKKIGLKNVLVIFAATVATIAPWMLWTSIRFPHEFVHENLGILHHLNENVESWAAPWDQVVFYYWISIFHVYYPAIIAAAALFVFHAWRERNFNSTLIIVWAAGVAMPNLLATSKPMSATLIGWPAAWLMLGGVVSRAMNGDRVALGAWIGAMVLGIVFLKDKSIPAGGENWGRNDLPMLTVMREHSWVLWEAMSALGMGGLLGLTAVPQKMRAMLVWGGGCAMVFLAAAAGIGKYRPGYAAVAWKVTSLGASRENFASLVEFAGRLPANAGILVDEHQRLENKLVEFATNRSCYAATRETWPKLAEDLKRAGAVPYLLTPVALPLPVVFVDPSRNLKLYLCTP